MIAECFEETVNLNKWRKLVHKVVKAPFTVDSPLPPDLVIKVQVRLAVSMVIVIVTETQTALFGKITLCSSFDISRDPIFFLFYFSRFIRIESVEKHEKGLWKNIFEFFGEYIFLPDDTENLELVNKRL